MTQQTVTQATPGASANKEGKGAKEQLGPVLCWAVVFADIGTSIYYVPGILYGTIGKLAGFFVFLTMIVFILLTLKYVEVTYRFPQGGGVVTVAAQALNRWFGALGGMFILVDYFLTSAISSLSGMLYLSVVLPAIGPQTSFLGLNLTLWITLVILILLGILNWVGISESARLSLIGAIIAFASDIAILITVSTHISFGDILALFPKMFVGRALTPVSVLVGFAGSFLAFSGLESISQLSPEMKIPRRLVGKIALLLVVLTVGLTSPLLTMLSTLLLPDAANNPVLSAQIISLLGGHWKSTWGTFLQVEVAVSASALLVFASNTAIIGAYHVFMALSRMEFFPSFILQRNKLRGTPHYSIILATVIPMLVLVLVRGNINTLGDMYAFGLLGAFTLTCIGMDIVRYRQRKARRNAASQVISSNNNNAAAQTPAATAEGNGNEHNPKSGQIVAGTPREEQEQTASEDRPEPEGPWTRSTFNFYLGIITTILVIVAWSTNLVAKPLATAFGGSVALVGMGIAYFNYRQQRKKGRLPVMVTGVEKPFSGSILAILTTDEEHNNAVIERAIHSTEKRPVVFLYIGEHTYNGGREPELFKLIAPHLDDPRAREDFSKANHQAQEAGIECRFVYRHKDHDAARRVWEALRPNDIIIAAEDLTGFTTLSHEQVQYEQTPAGQIAHIKMPQVKQDDRTAH